MDTGSGAIEAWLKALPGASGLPFWPPPSELYSVAKLYAGLSPDDAASWRSVWDSQIYQWRLGADGKPRSLDA